MENAEKERRDSMEAEARFCREYMKRIRSNDRKTHQAAKGLKAKHDRKDGKTEDREKRRNSE